MTGPAPCVPDSSEGRTDVPLHAALRDVALQMTSDKCRSLGRVGNQAVQRTVETSMTPRLADLWRPLVAGVFVVVSVGIVLIGAAEPAGACSCAPWTDEEAIEHADAAFSGTLVEVSSTTEGGVSSADPERFVFDVHDVFKGEVMETQTVVTPRSGASCGLEISGPGPHLVFAYDDSQLTPGAGEHELHSHLCSGTRALADGDVPVDFVSRPPMSTESTPSSSEPSTESATPVADNGGIGPWMPVAMVAGALVLVAAAVWGLLRARTSSRSRA